MYNIFSYVARHIFNERFKNINNLREREGFPRKSMAKLGVGYCRFISGSISSWSGSCDHVPSCNFFNVNSQVPSLSFPRVNVLHIMGGIHCRASHTCLIGLDQAPERQLTKTNSFHTIQRTCSWKMYLRGKAGYRGATGNYLWRKFNFTRLIIFVIIFLNVLQLSATFHLIFNPFLTHYIFHAKFFFKCFIFL